MEKKLRPAFQACFFVLLMAMSLTVASHAQVQCWAPRVEEDAPRNPKWPNLLHALMTTDDIVHKNAAFIDQKVPVRMCTTISAGPAANAIRWKQDPAFPDFKDPNRIQVIIVRVTSSDDKMLTEPGAVLTEPSAWSKRVRDTLDYAALASLIR